MSNTTTDLRLQLLRDSNRRHACLEEQEAWLAAALAYECTDICLEWPFATQKGYGAYRDPNTGRTYRAHREITRRAHGEPPTPEHEASHSCHNKRCCNKRHLSWQTHAENMALSAHLQRGERNPRAKLTEHDVRYIRQMPSAATAAKKFGISLSAAFAVRNRSRWGHVQ